MIRIDFACNDDGGNPTGRFEAVHWDFEHGYDALELTVQTTRPLAMTDNGYELRVLRRWFPYERSKGWFGNWIWDAYWFRPPVAKAVLRHMRASGKLSCDGGPTRLFDWWNVTPVDARST